jgi:uncharacterized tellurite resistance protein B-like protein
MKDTPSNETLHEKVAKTVVNQAYLSPPPTPELSMIVRSLASILLGQAVADGEVYETEMRRIERILKKTFYVDDAHIERLVREALNDSVDIGSLAFENSLTTLRERFLPHQRERFKDALMEVAQSDGYFDERERCFLYYVSKRLGL